MPRLSKEKGMSKEVCRNLISKHISLETLLQMACSSHTIAFVGHEYGVTYEVSSLPKATALLEEPSAFNCSLNLHLHGRKLSFQKKKKIPNCPIVSYRVLRLFLSFPLTGHTFLPLCLKTSSSYGQNIICVCV